MTNIEKIVVGSLGGLSAILVKYLGQDHGTVMQFFSTDLPISKLNPIFYGYLIITPIIITLGAIIGWVADETNRLKLFALGISAPALITTWSGGNVDSKIVDIQNLLSPAPAYALEGPNPQLALLGKSVDTFFGSNQDFTYAVHVGSFLEESNADHLIRKIESSSKSLRAYKADYVDPQGRKFHRVLVIRLLSLREALSLRDSIKKSGVSDYSAVLDILS